MKDQFRIFLKFLFYLIWLIPLYRQTSNFFPFSEDWKSVRASAFSFAATLSTTVKFSSGAAASAIVFSTSVALSVGFAFSFSVISSTRVKDIGCSLIELCVEN